MKIYQQILVQKIWNPITTLMQCPTANITKWIKALLAKTTVTKGTKWQWSCCTCCLYNSIPLAKKLAEANTKPKLPRDL